ncbi:MAG: hypothetical protein ACRD44_03020 [Bryobacteraceae bacterium]
MRSGVTGGLLVSAIAVLAQAPEPPPGLLAAIKTRMDDNLRRLPNYTCAQEVQRSYRDGPAVAYRPMDTLRLEVGLIDGQERFSWLDSKQFEEKSLADLIGTGATGTGSFALHAGSVFRPRVADFIYQGIDKLNDRESHKYDYEVPAERSRYRLRVGKKEAVVGFRGSFWVDKESMELIRLEVHADAIPDEVGLISTSDWIEYGRTRLGESEFLLPKSSEMIMIDRYGHETRNRTTFSRCRQYMAESRLVTEAEPSVAAPSTQPGAPALPLKTLLEISLESDFAPEKAAVGDSVRAVLDKPVKEGERIIAGKGAIVLGRVTRVEKDSVPFPHYVVGLQFHALDAAGERLAFTATMEEAGPAAGLVREAKRMDPVFTKNRAPRFNILVREQHRGQGILHWEAKRPVIPRGFRMKWLVAGDER